MSLTRGCVQNPEGDRNGDGGKSCRGEQQFSGEVESLQDTVGHDVNHPLFEIGASDARDADQGRTETEFTDFQNAFGVDVTITAEFEHFFIAGALALVDEARAEPPDERIEPEDRFDQHVQCGVEIVTAADMPDLMRENRFQVRVFQVRGDASGPE